MATIQVTIPDANVAEALAAIERTWKSDAINTLFAGVAADYEALTNGQKFKACMRIFIIRTVQNIRRQEAEAAITIAPPVDVT